MTATSDPAAANLDGPGGSRDGDTSPPTLDVDVSLVDLDDLDGSDDGSALRPPTDDELAHLADLAFGSATTWLNLPDRFYTLARGAGIDPDSAAAEPVRRALGFFLAEETHSGRRSVELRWKTGFDSDSLPLARLRSLADAESEAWERIANKSTHPAARARFLDMLVLRGGKGTPDHAAAAVDAYLDHATLPATVIKLSDGQEVERSWVERGLALSLGRALSLSRIAAGAATGPSTIKRALTVALTWADNRIHSNRPQVGSAVSTLAILTANRALLQPAELAKLLSL